MRSSSRFLSQMVPAALVAGVFGSQAFAADTLEDFSALLGDSTYFAGSWESAASVSGSTTPQASLTQGEGVFNVDAGGATNDAGSFLERHFTTPIDLGEAQTLSVKAHVLSGNEATAIEVRLFDTAGASAYAMFEAAAFAGDAPATVSAMLVASSQFDASQVEVLRLSGGLLDGDAAFAVSFDEITFGGSGAFHSGDYNQDGALDLTELLRIIELYNTRNGTVRTGAYAVASASVDGFSSDASRLAESGVALARYHSGDYDRDGYLSLTELLRVIELYNYREGTVRTGEYAPSPDSVDGFATGPRS
ncbi:hypothetical protein [Actomonas aquatica]|uniref:EF-hand domain-containing protein n=1 Tax=Actomonas aquatica TaxID=2866162 RepID=A0ABZ1CB35_9BACT|nr:hypothetical protein [Opitutus sp. WL0086]WRQ88713.1 hypothetical protein K1X11_004805 [Opitutus sp. WL0086]